MDSSVDSLYLSVINNKSQEERIDILRKKIKGRVSIAKYLVETQQQFHLIETDKIGNISNGRIITDSIRDIITAINAEEYGLLKKHKTEMQSNKGAAPV
jgi:CHASE3 domain sensor protein